MALLAGWRGGGGLGCPLLPTPAQQLPSLQYPASSVCPLPTRLAIEKASVAFICEMFPCVGQTAYCLALQL